MGKWTRLGWRYAAVAWGAAKRDQVLEKHNVHLNSLANTLLKGEGMERVDDREDYEEERRQGMAMIEFRLFFFAFTVRLPYTARIITARKANDREREKFKQGMQDDE